MEATISLDEKTRGLLSSIKARENFASDSDAIRHLVETHQDTATMFGITKNTPLRFTKEDEMKFHEL